jgi:hypothetical protein
MFIPTKVSASGKVARQIFAQFQELDNATSGPVTYPTCPSPNCHLGEMTAGFLTAHL